jgi:hypothetical protein
MYGKGKHKLAKLPKQMNVGTKRSGKTCTTKRCPGHKIETKDRN